MRVPLKMTHWTKKKMYVVLCLGLVSCVGPLVLYQSKNSQLRSGEPESKYSRPRSGEPESKLNVILIMFDDLRPALGVYGDKKALTPNMDQLGAHGVVFDAAFAQEAVCGPSRTSLLTSRRPDSTITYSNNFKWRQVRDFITLPQYFKRNGYHSQSFGKIFHNQVNTSFNDMPYSWSATPYRPITGLLLKKYKMAPVCEGIEGSSFNIVCPLDREVNAVPLPDTQIRRRTTEFLESWKTKNTGEKKPLFLGVGFSLPHIPFKIPTWATGFHPLKDVHGANNSFRSPGVPGLAFNAWKVLFSGAGDWPEKASLVRHYYRQMKQFYYSSISFVDQKVGKLLETIVNLGYADNSIICLIADHGWHLGEHGIFAKNTNFEEATRVPWIIYDPRVDSLNDFVKADIGGYKANPEEFPRMSYKPRKLVKAPVELLDVYPTLVSLAGLPSIPKCPKSRPNTLDQFCLEGKSHAKVVLSDRTIPQDSVAFSQYPRPSLEPTSHSSNIPLSQEIKYMGYAVRTWKYRFVAWFGFNSDLFKTDFQDVVALELYDREVDPQENVNQANGTHYLKPSHELLQMIRDKFDVPPNPVPASIW